MLSRIYIGIRIEIYLYLKNYVFLRLIVNWTPLIHCTQYISLSRGIASSRWGVIRLTILKRRQQGGHLASKKPRLDKEEGEQLEPHSA
jgi:hypothetical protein